jgi:nitrogen-specific signal transduction histidine kinase/CheY-like chemotaxis protein
VKTDVVFALEHAAWPALLVDEAGIVRRANPSAVALFGPALEGECPLLAALLAPQEGGSAEAFLARWEHAPSPSAQLKFKVKGGVVATFPTSICSFTKGEQKFFVLQLLPESAGGAPKNQASDNSLAQKQKLDCALQLARTVSLDFNNALTAILGHTSLLLSRLEPGHSWRSALMEIEKSAARAAEIASDLGTFSRQDKVIPAHAAGNLNLLVQRNVELFKQTATSVPIEWGLQLERKLFAARFDEAKMQQALLKVLENAVEALRDRGRVTIQTRNFELTQPTQDRNVQLAAGAYVSVEISDDGCGIEPAVLPRIFEPFFTTKRRTDHRGLGLAWVYGVVTNHGGGVAVSSQPNVGTSVRLYLPAERRVAKTASVGPEDLGGKETILLVDDEDLLLSMGQTVLSAYGYRVLTANGGEKALAILNGQNAAVDVVITDLVMPAMSGRELIENVHRISPAMRILCISGYAWPPGQHVEDAYLQKPFTTQELLAKVRSVLDNSPAK